MQTGHNKTSTSSATLRAVLSLCAALLFLLAFASQAFAAKEHLYDPALSLTGKCTTNTADPVLDPGCVGEPPAYPAGEAPRPFEGPCGTTTDSHGDIYVSSAVVNNEGQGPEGRIDVFDPQGKFLTEINDGYAPCGLAVDSKGNLYVAHYGYEGSGQERVFTVFLFEPASYPPAAGTEYTLGKSFESAPDFESICHRVDAVAVDPSNDHLYLRSCGIREYGSATEGSPLIEEGIATGYGGGGFDIFGKNHDIYLASASNQTVYVLDGATEAVKCEVTGIPLEGGGQEPFSFVGATVTGVAVDQANGDFYVWDTEHRRVDQFAVKGEECTFVVQLPKPPNLVPYYIATGVVVDDPYPGEKLGAGGYDSPNEGYVFAASGTTSANSHLYAFKPKASGPPEVRNQKVSGIGETEALLEAELKSNGFDTHYRFEYLTETAYLANGEGFSGPEPTHSVPLPDADAGSGGSFLNVSEPVTGLEPGVSYRFRLVASNCEDPGAEPANCLTAGEGNPGGEGEAASFATYPAAPAQSCPNAALRTGPSAALPDCRAYELVTPADTNGRIPTMELTAGINWGENGFDTWIASPEPGLDSVVFGSNSGALPGLGGSGYFDTYEALRDPSGGWQSRFTGMSGAQAERPSPGGISPDHGYAFWYAANGLGQLAIPGNTAQYLRVPAGGPEPSPNCAPAAEPEGQFEWVGCGSLGTDPHARGKWISSGGAHVIFATENVTGQGTAQKLEPCAPESGQSAIYDRTPGGPTRCISLLPDSSPAPGARFAGVAVDGSAVAFTSGGSLFVRLDDEKTLEVAGGSPTFGGLSQDGSRVYFIAPNPGEPLLAGTGIPQGEIFACDLQGGPCAGPEATQAPTPVGSGDESVLVNVSADGSHAYFVSRAELTPGEENEWEEEAEIGKENLYVWDGSTVRFIAQLEPLDITGYYREASTAQVGGLGLWVNDALERADPVNGPANDPSRTTPDGRAMVFESHGQLAGPYDTGGHVEVYRYDTEAEVGMRLRCLSCNPTGAAAHSDAQLQVDPSGLSPGVPFPPVSSITHIANVSEDGQKVFFQSADRLVSADVDGFVDVYEWEAQGTGGCERQAGCISLISGPHSTEDDYLYSVTPNGHDAFIMSGDSLLTRDPDRTPSVYDARIDGGFPEPSPPAGECLGEACQPTVVAPNDPTPASSSFEGSGNVHEESPMGLRCPKGKHKVKTRGKVHCVKRHPKAHRRRNHRANANRRTAR